MDRITIFGNHISHMKFFNKIILILVIFYSSSLMSEMICEVLDYKECKVSDKGKLDCSNEIYFDATNPNQKGGLRQFDNPPIKKIRIHSNFKTYAEGYLKFESLKIYSDGFYKNMFNFKCGYGSIKKCILSKEPNEEVVKILYLHDPFYSTFLLTESFYVNSNLISRISSGNCHD